MRNMVFIAIAMIMSISVFSAECESMPTDSQTMLIETVGAELCLKMIDFSDQAQLEHILDKLSFPNCYNDRRVHKAVADAIRCSFECGNIKDPRFEGYMDNVVKFFIGLIGRENLTRAVMAQFEKK